MFNRRQFLKTGIAGSALLAAGGAWFFLTHRDAEVDALFAVVGSAMLSGVLPERAPERTTALARQVAGMHATLAALSPNAQAELAELFGLLTFAPTRFALTGVVGSWQAATADDAKQFLERWRNASSGLVQAAYSALHDIVFGTWYAAAENWKAIGYAGPPTLAEAAP